MHRFYGRKDVATHQTLKISAKSVTAKVQFVKKFVVRRARQWIHDLMTTHCFMWSLKKKLGCTGKITPSGHGIKQQIWELIEQFLNQKPEGCVTPFSCFCSNFCCHGSNNKVLIDLIRG